MAKLRITDAALLSTVKGNEKIPTGEVGNYAVSIDQVAAYTKEKLNLEDSTSVDNKVLDVQTDIDLHKNDLLNPHQVTKTQVGLGNVDNTSDLDKPLSNADITALSLKADKTYVDSQDQLKADKTTVEGLLLLKADKSYVDSQDQLKADKTTVEASLLLKADKVDLTASKVSSDGGQTQQEINDFGGAKWHSKLGGYDLGATVKLENGDIVKSTVANNSTNPNINMTGWFVPYMRGSQNLVELTDKATSRSNLDVYSKGEALAKDNNLSELSDKAVARTNLDVYSKAETNTAISNATTPNATETTAGKAKIATTAIAQAGVNDTDFITPLKLRNALNANGSAPVYACRAWVNFNGVGTVAILGSGNVSSITDNGVGDYTVNYTVALPDTNYAIIGSSTEHSDGTPLSVSLRMNGTTPLLKTSTATRISTRYAYLGGFYDVNNLSLEVTR